MKGNTKSSISACLATEDDNIIVSVEIREISAENYGDAIRVAKVFFGEIIERISK